MNKYYEAKYLRGVIRKALPLRLFFRTRFFSEGLTYPTETVSFEFARDQRRLLPYAGPDGRSVSVGRTGYQLRTFTPPLLSGSRMINEDTLSMKVLGESEWNGMSPDERAAKIAATDLMELQDYVYRKEEYMCARLKQDGKLQTPKGELDYGFENMEQTSASDKWTENYDVLGKLREVSRELGRDGINADMLILGESASQALYSNKGFQKILANQNKLIELGTSEELEDGVVHICRLSAPGLMFNVYEYREMYYDETAGEMKPLLDPETVIVQSSRERNYMLYGSVQTIGRDKSVVSEMAEYVPYVVTSEDPPGRKLIVSSRPLPMPVDMKSWYVLKDVVSGS